MKIFFAAPSYFFEKELLEEFSFVDFTFLEIWDLNDLSEINLEEFDIFIPNPGWNFLLTQRVWESIPGSGGVKIISTPSTGLNHLSSDLQVEVVGLRSDPLALSKITASGEFTILLALALLRNPDYARHEVLSGRWRQNENAMRGRELSSMRVVVLGAGRNGSMFIRFLNAIGCTSVSYIDPAVGIVEGAKRRSLDDEADADVLIITCALESETIGIVNKEFLNRLGQGLKYIVNTSRGELVIEEDLADWLTEDSTRRFAADTLSGEVGGTQFTSRLLSRDLREQVFITPHVAGASDDSQTKAAFQAINNATKYLPEG